MDERYGALSAAGDPLERLAAVVDFELFRPDLDAALDRSEQDKGGRPPYDAVHDVQGPGAANALHALGRPDRVPELKDRLSFMRFLGLALEDRVPDAKTIWLYREQLTRAGAIERLFAGFNRALRDAGYLAMSGQIVDATVVEARRPRLTEDEKATVKSGGVPESLVAGQARADGHRRPLDDQARAATPARRRGGPQARVAAAIAVPVFGYKNHLGIDRRHGFIRRFAVTDAASHDGRQLGRLLDPDNTASGVWADSAYRSAANRALLARRGLVPSSSGRSRGASRCRGHLARGNAS